MPKFLLAFLPPKDVSEEIIVFQKELETRFGSKHAQRVPPHLTIIPPFDCDEESLIGVIKDLQSAKKENKTLEVNLSNFQRFNSRTLFVDIKKNELLENFCKDVKSLFYHSSWIKKRIEKHFFVPHITIANKDLNKRNFKLAWNDFKIKEYQRNFTLNKMVVLKLEGDLWSIYKTIKI